MITKKIQFIVIIILSTLILAGCVKKPIENEMKNDKLVEVASSSDEIQKEIATTTEELVVITSDIDTSDWQTYRDKEHGFEFKYPKNWIYEISDSGFVQFKDINNTVYYEGSEIYLVGISVDKSQNDFNIENWKELKVKRKGSVRNIKIGNLSGVEASDYLSVDVVIDKDEKRYKLTKPNVESPNINDIFYGLLNSWKFID